MLNKSNYILTSFYYFKDALPYQPQIHLVDSGAFTFFSSGKKFDVDKYVGEFINYINEFDIKYFFELDIDVLVGYDKVLEIRKRIENGTNKKCIPVWHYFRGKDEFIKMCKEYEYAAIGGIASKEKIARYPEFYIKFNKIANSYGCKLHGLGLTGKIINTAGFYSVDSTSWKSGRRFAQIHKFNGEFIKITSKKDKRLVDYNGLDNHNLNEWLKYQKYLENKGVR